MTLPAARQGAGGAPLEEDELAGSHACYNVYRCRDGRHLAVGALEPKFWEALTRALGRPALLPRQWESGPVARETVRTVADILATKDRDEWVRELEAADACVEPVLELAEALDQPQVRHRRAVVEDVEGEVGPAAGLRTLASPLRLSATPATARRPAPRLGQHTDEVLAEAGYAPEEIAALRTRRVVG
jgi:crotonobetainyl-CoA:carnitine CoA-transferase CaiB-like acyl-CoA transferase